FSVLLAVFAVVDTPDGALQPAPAARGAVPTALQPTPIKATKSHQSSPGAADFSDECAFPSFCPPREQASSAEDCDTTSSPHQKAHQGSQRGAKSDPTDDC